MKISAGLTAIAFVLASSASACSVGGDPPADGGALDQRPPASADELDAAELQALVGRTADAGLFMGAAFISRRGVVLLDRAYGYANAEWDVPNTTTTKFRVGSITKNFTAAAILLLEEEGRLHVEDRLALHVPEIPPTWSTITLHQLLTHSAGIPDVVAFPEYPTIRPQPSSPEKMLQLVRDRPLDFAPGARFQYSNTNYIMLALVIERLTGRPYDDFLRARLLAPLGLENTAGDAPRPLTRHRAAGYVPLTAAPGMAPPAPTPPSPIAIRNADFIDMTMPTGAGSLISTTGDLQRWLRALFTGQVLSEASLAKMTTVHLANYGYGLFIGEDKGLRRMGHGGSIHGFLSSLTYYPETDVVLVVLANLTAGEALSDLTARMADIANGKGGGDAGAAFSRR